MKQAFILLALASCTVDIEPYNAVEVQAARELDVLFVLDDSSDRARYDQMTQQLGTLTARLSDIDGQLPSLHVGVVSTDLGTDSKDDFPVPAVNGCSGEGKAGKLQRYAAGITDDFLKDERAADGSRVQNFASGDLALELASLTNPAADDGCEFEQPLEAMRRALDPATNPGFLRDTAMLNVVFLTNEDDCSVRTGGFFDPWTQSERLGPLTSFRCTAQGVTCTTEMTIEGPKYGCRPTDGSPLVVDVSEYETFLAGLKVDRGDVVVSAVAGPPDPVYVADVGVNVLAPSCSGPTGAAQPAVRLNALVEAFGGALVESCNQDAAYEKLTAPLVNGQRTCFPSLRQADGEDCEVMEIAGDTQTALAPCTDGSTGPCWYKFEDALACPRGDNYGIAVKRATGSAIAGARIEARCFVE